MEYDNSLQEHRAKLANSVVGVLTTLGFKLDPHIKAKELVYSRMLKDNMKISVYTTAVRNNYANTLEVRKVGKDAIRIAILYNNKDGFIKPVGKKTSMKTREQSPK